MKIEPIGQLRAGALNAAALGEAVCTMVLTIGPCLVSMSEQGDVFVTAERHPFSEGMLRQYGDRCVGVYRDGCTPDGITEDLIEQWRTDREAAA